MITVTDELRQTLTAPGVRIDLHTHSNASDGKMSPEELVRHAAAAGVALLALTDHDTCAGTERAALECAAVGIHFVSGIEISTLWRGREIHVVGLSMDRNAAAMTALLERQRLLRDERARAIGEKLEKCGFKDAYRRTLELAGDNAVITRGNYTDFLYREGAADTPNKCFANYLAEGRRAYVKPSWCSLEEAVNAIMLSGGIAVLAHPRCYDFNNKWLRMLITDFKGCGGEAMEVSGCMQSPADRDFLQELSREYALFASCGSDFHRECKYISIGGCWRMADNVNPVWNHEKFKLEV